jgi:2-oxoglutarate ferredoxin oxidoreductase subunit alpha
MKNIYNGSQILVKAAMKASVGFFAGYPITPATKILENFALESYKNTNLIFLQSEDEIAAIHHVIGASIGGKKAMTATSGPGFSLMQEGLDLAFACSIPLVVVNVMRQGPSTGMPTKSSQGDLLQTQFGPHGDYKSIVFYPNSIEEIYRITIEAFNASEEASSPVIILLDAAISNLYETIDLKNRRVKNVKHNLIFGSLNRHLSGLVTDKNGIPETDNFKIYKAWIEQKFKKITEVSKRYDYFEYIRSKNAVNLIISFGPVPRLISISKKYSIFRPITLFPTSGKLIDISKKYKKIIVIEMNEGQYSFYLKSFIKRDIETISITQEDLDPDKLSEKINEKI